MKSIIGKKQTSDNAAFVRAWQSIDELVSKDEAAALVERTVEKIRRETAGKKVGFAWSGGKDSLALQYVCEQAGVTDCVLGIARDLEYPAFLKWVEEHKPAGLRIWNNDKLTLAWLANHPEMLFPRKSSQAARWFSIIQHRAQAWFFRELDLDIIILGRRTQDGNYTGPGGIYTDGKGVTRFSPIMDWKHEEILAVIHYFMGGGSSANLRLGKRLRRRHGSIPGPSILQVSPGGLGAGVSHRPVRGGTGLRACGFRKGVSKVSNKHQVWQKVK